MGKAFHRKQISSGRGTKTHGTGIFAYSKSLSVSAGKEPKAPDPENVREWNVYCLLHVAGFALDGWEDERLKGADSNPQLERVVDRAFTTCNTAITRCCNSTGIDVERLLQALHRARFGPDVLSALQAVQKRFSTMFEKLQSQ
jgi:hypothetical protein